VVKQIAALADERAAIAVLCGDDRFACLLSDFLEDLVETLIEKISRVRTGGAIEFSILDNSVDRGESLAQIALPFV